MKKIVAGLMIPALALLVSSGITLAISNNDISSNNENLFAINEENSNTLNVVDELKPKDETVYVMSKASGETNKIFVDNNLLDTPKELPVKLNISYYLNGNELSAQELNGKSGHVKIKYVFSSIKSYQNKLVPFLAVTGLELDNNKFKNLKLENGKIVKETQNSTFVAGYSLVGLNENLGIDFLPDEFSFEADVENFELKTTYSFITNDFFSDVDTTKLNSINDIVNQMNQLSSVLDQIISGAGELSGGLDSAFDGAKKLQAGTNELNSGAHKLADGANAISGGLSELAGGAKQLSDGLDSVLNVNNQIMAKVTPITERIDAEIVTLNNYIAEISETNPELSSELTKIVEQLTGYYNQAHSAVNEYVGGIKQLADGAEALESGAGALATGANELKIGALSLATGTDELKNGTDSLVGGLEQLAGGGKTLYSGLSSFKSQGIDRLVNFANQDLRGFSDNFRATVDAAKSYHYYDNSSANSVKFVFKISN